MIESKPTKTMRQLLAVNVRRLRNRLALSQEVLAEQAGFHRTYVSQVERCRVNIRLDNLDRLADALGVYSYELLEEGEQATCAVTAGQHEA